MLRQNPRFYSPTLDRGLYRNERQQLGCQRAALRWAAPRAWPSRSAALDGGPAERPYEILEFDDGSIRVVGVLPHLARERLLLTHDEGGYDSEGRVIWHRKGSNDDDA